MSKIHLSYTSCITYALSELKLIYLTIVLHFVSVKIYNTITIIMIYSTIFYYLIMIDLLIYDLRLTIKNEIY